MRIKEVVVTACRTIHNPAEKYSYFKPSVTLRATLKMDEDYAPCVEHLQGMAERFLVRHVEKMMRIDSTRADLERLLKVLDGGELTKNEHDIYSKQFDEFIEKMGPSVDFMVSPKLKRRSDKMDSLRDCSF